MICHLMIEFKVSLLSETTARLSSLSSRILKVEINSTSRREQYLWLTIFAMEVVIHL